MNQLKKRNIGIIGMGVMGRNLALNIEGKGYSVSVYDAWPEALKKASVDFANREIDCCTGLGEFAESLPVPRKILMMVKAGDVVDETIRSVIPFLSEGDLLIDGGNSFYKDTQRRYEHLKTRGIHFLGMGVSGGEEGALNGPALMPGGDEEGYNSVRKLLLAISAKAEGEPCCSYIGMGGAGHFVKMVHNGIEYADMGLISEAYFMLKEIAGLSNAEIGQVFLEWNKGELNSYLVEITARILATKDPETGKDMVDVILDSAGQKGTGKLTGQVALDLGVPLPSITEAVFARYLSSLKEERKNAAKHFCKLSFPTVPKEKFIELVRTALYTAKIIAYAQGFALMRAASLANGWGISYSTIAGIFRGGCIIRAQFLNHVMKAYTQNPQLPNLILDEYFSESIRKWIGNLRETVAIAIRSGIPVPVLASTITYFDSYTREQLPANLLQAQRDYFGAHTFERTDKQGTCHFDWMNAERTDETL